MRKDIRLLINGQTADLADDNLVLWNYTVEDLESPAAVKNAYTQSVTLPATSRNAVIFDHIERADHRVTGVFSPLQKTPFEIRNEREEVLMEGYLKLDGVKSQGRKVMGYDVTLYGGLGSFLYGLMYKADGTKKTLADLDYTTGGGADELDFTVNKATIRKAWLNIVAGKQPGQTDYDEKWHVINFAPAYEGLPNDFDANKVLVEDSDQNSGMPGQSGHGGYVLATVDGELDASEVRDFRSYLQRPVVRVSKVLEAISDPAQNGGYTVNMPLELQDDIHAFAWATLKPLTGVDYSRTDTFQGIGFYTEYPRASVNVNAWDTYVQNPFDAAPSAYLTAEFQLHFSMFYGGTENTLYRAANNKGRGLAVQVQALDEFGNIVGGSPVLIFTNGYAGRTYAQVADDIKDALTFDSTVHNIWEYFKDNENGRLCFMTGSAVLPINAKYVRTSADGDFELRDASNNNTFTISVPASYNVKEFRLVSGFVTDAPHYVFTDDDAFYTATDATGIKVTAYNRASPFTLGMEITRTLTAARTGATITKALLLNTDYTPADFLVSYCKQRGWLIVKDRDAKVINIMRKEDFYDTLKRDIDDRIDRSREGSDEPAVAKTLFYRLAVEQLPTGIAEQYEKRYDAVYGQHRLNTNYGFNTDTTDVLQNNIFRACVMYQRKGHRYSCPVVGLNSLWSWQTLGYKITYGDKTNPHTVEYPGAVPASWSHYNGYGNTFADAFARPLFADAENKGVAAEGVLLLFQKSKAYQGPDYMISDDTAEMFYQNDDRPCWLQAFNAGTDTIACDEVPQFRRYLLTGLGMKERGDILDMGDSKVSYDLNVDTFNSPCSVWDREWAEWMTDRYAQDNRIVTRWVDLRGMTVDEWLLAGLFHFDGCDWRLNKVTDYELGGDRVTKCEFIKTQR